MKSLRIAFFDTKPYDKESFEAANKKYGFDIKYFRYHLTPDNIILAQNFDIVVVFVNDIINRTMIDTLVSYE